MRALAPGSCFHLTKFGKVLSFLCFATLLALFVAPHSTLADDSKPAITETPAISETIVLPIDYINGEQFGYYADLLELSTAQIGVHLILDTHAIVTQPRMEYNMKYGLTALRPFVRSAKRDNQFTPVEIDLTNGLIGKRIAFLAPEKIHLFSDVRSLEQLQAVGAKAGLGLNWFDVQVWESNSLAVTPIDGDWQRIYDMLYAGNRRIDYFPRGINEILTESMTRPELAIDPHLLLVYDRDFRFYLSRPYAEYKPLLEKALREAARSGLMQRLQQKHWGELYEALNLQERTVIRLDLPEKS